jgi:hypothetical protein
VIAAPKRQLYALLVVVALGIGGAVLRLVLILSGGDAGVTLFAGGQVGASPR